MLMYYSYLCFFFGCKIIFPLLPIVDNVSLAENMLTESSTTPSSCPATASTQQAIAFTVSDTNSKYILCFKATAFGGYVGSDNIW